MLRLHISHMSILLQNVVKIVILFITTSLLYTSVKTHISITIMRFTRKLLRDRPVNFN